MSRKFRFSPFFERLHSNFNSFDMFFFVFLFHLTLPCFDSVDVLAVFDVVDGSDDLVGGGGGERDARIDEDDENDVVEGIDVLDVEESLSLYQSTEEES